MSVEQRVNREVGLTPVDSATNDPQELPVEVRLDRDALVGSEDPDAVNFAGLHDRGLLVGVEGGLVTDVAIVGRVLVLSVPQGATATQVVREEYLEIAIEDHFGRRTPAPCELVPGSNAGLGVKRSVELGARSSVSQTSRDR